MKEVKGIFPDLTCHHSDIAVNNAQEADASNWVPSGANTYQRHHSACSMVLLHSDSSLQ